MLIKRIYSEHFQLTLHTSQEQKHEKKSKFCLNDILAGQKCFFAQRVWCFLERESLPLQYNLDKSWFQTLKFCWTKTLQCYGLMWRRLKSAGFSFWFVETVVKVQDSFKYTLFSYNEFGTGLDTFEFVPKTWKLKTWILSVHIYIYMNRIL